MGAGTRSWRLGKRRFSRLQATHFLLPSIFPHGARTGMERSTLIMRNGSFFYSFGNGAKITSMSSLLP